MDIAKLTMESENVEYEKLIWQNEIKTVEQALQNRKDGYAISLPEGLFKEIFDKIPTDCVCYAYGQMAPAFYWNRKTMVAADITALLIMCVQNPQNSQAKEMLYHKISANEALAAKHKYEASLRELKGELCMEYFNVLYERNTKPEDLYALFVDAYNMTDYGVSRLKREIFDWIVSSKTDAEKEATLNKIKFLPDVLTIYRGETKGVSATGSDAYSWTTDIRNANFFATRLGGNEAEIIVAEIKKDKIIELIDARNESEVLAKYEDVIVKDRIEVWGKDRLEKIRPYIIDKFEDYECCIDDFDFISDIHGAEHTKRVLLHMLILCHLMNIPEEEIDMLCTAVTYHDVGRHCDGIDDDHGRASKKIYEEDVKNPSPIISFLIEYHSLPDEMGYKEIDNNPILRDNKEMITRLYKIFKDADGLDRVRLGLKDLDITYLRTEYSKHLTKIARIFLDRANVRKEYI